ncbi:hypothetical protein MTR67_001926 [Solanum verrucosum]|uniref:Uncharacterized protein n=1 Tax=Solanum verrucosum TaxID=315347 RepID=A0AAF0T7X6_SOLVR|nr:hypothetical protein MTR67_001926 [Solanum verrucosum]
MLIFLDDPNDEIPDCYGHLRSTQTQYSQGLLYFEVLDHMVTVRGIGFGNFEVWFRPSLVHTIYFFHFGACACTAIWISPGTGRGIVGSGISSDLFYVLLVQMVMFCNDPTGEGLLWVWISAAGSYRSIDSSFMERHGIGYHQASTTRNFAILSCLASRVISPAWYRKGAFVSEDDSVLNMHEAPTGRRRDYIPCSEPESRLPHMNVKLLSIQ